MSKNLLKSPAFTRLVRQAAASSALPKKLAALIPEPEPAKIHQPAGAGPQRPAKLPRGEVAEWGRTLAYLDRGPDVRLRVAVERWIHGPVLTVVEWRRDREGWYPRRSRCAAFEITELDQVASLFEQAKAAAKELGPEVSGAK